MIQSTTLEVGLVPLARTTFDLALATEVLAEIRSRLGVAGFSLSGSDKLVTDLDGATAVARICHPWEMDWLGGICFR